jgi:hypothetical protein
VRKCWVCLGLVTQFPDLQYFPDGFDLIELSKEPHRVEIRILSHEKPSSECIEFGT